MGQVLSTTILYKDGYRFRTSFFGKQILQVREVCQTWDTNTGHDDGPPFGIWRDATKSETERISIFKH